MAREITKYNNRSRDLSLFDDFFDSMLGAWDNYSANLPAVDVEENGDSYVIKAELPRTGSTWCASAGMRASRGPSACPKVWTSRRSRRASTMVC